MIVYYFCCAIATLILVVFDLNKWRWKVTKCDANQGSHGKWLLERLCDCVYVMLYNLVVSPVWL